MSNIGEIALNFFDACETGKGWENCQSFCHSDATFSAQADVLAELTTIEAYANWMKTMFTPIPNGRYEIKFFATDAERESVAAVAVFHGTHTGPGGPVEPTGKTVAADYVYAMTFNGDKICHMTKIWNDNFSLRQLGWT